MHRFGVTILGVLNQKYHEEGDDCRRGVYDQLPSVREMKCRASEDPDEDDEHRPAKGPGGHAEEEPVDFGFLARSGSLRRNTAPIGAGFCVGPGALESAGYLSLRRSVWRNGTSLAGNDPRVRRPRFVRALQMAIHSRAAVPSRGLHRLF